MSQGIRHVCVLAPLMLHILFAVIINVAYACFKADKDIMDTLVHLRKNNGAGGGWESCSILSDERSHDFLLRRAVQSQA